MKILIQCANKEKRRARSRVIYFEEHPEVVEGLGEASKEELIILYLCIAQLPPKLREIALLIATYDYSSKEIAEYLNVPESTIRSRILETRKRLKAMLAEAESTASASSHRAVVARY
jgi:RNA polymerase sigma factor (sigma-70 family)